MNYDNPAEMSNADLEKDIIRRRNEEARKTTAAEGTLKTPEQDEASRVSNQTVFNRFEEQDMDDLVHRKASEKHNGSLPDPEELGPWEDREDADKISG